MRYIYSVLLIVLILVCAQVEALAVDVNCATTSLQAAITAAPINTLINVSGICNENILIDNDKAKIFIIGPATINGPDNSKPTFDIRAKAILLQNLTITGGRNGVEVHRSANAVINGNVIESTGNNGILVAEMGFAVIINNTIQNNASRGITVTGSSNANIGYNNRADSTASPNTIQGNVNGGIMVARSSSANIVGNIIQNNGSDGLFVQRSASADVAGNLINGNAGDGIRVLRTSTVFLGSDTGTTIFDLPNNTTVNNGGFGINCNLRVVIDGALNNQDGAPVTNPLAGDAGQTSISASCSNSTI